jgi:hypothetical protein
MLLLASSVTPSRVYISTVIRLDNLGRLLRTHRLEARAVTENILRSHVKGTVNAWVYESMPLYK